MRKSYFVKYQDLGHVIDVAPWCPCRRYGKGLYVVRLDPDEARKSSQWVWEVKK